MNRAEAASTPLEPLVIGAIGDYVEALFTSMIDSDSGSLTTYAGRHALWSSSPLRTWNSGSTQGYYWGALDPSVVPSSMADARFRSCAAGVVVSPDMTSLHGDLLGVSPIYYFKRGSAIYFSNRLGPVLRVCETPTLDPAAWLALVSLWYVPPGLSVVREIQTFRVGEVISHDSANKVLSTTIDSTTVTPDSRADVHDVVTAIGDAIVRVSPTALLLSGGYDSRILLAAALERRIKLKAFTTSKDDGFDRDVEVGGEVAAMTGTEHETILSTGPWDSWFEESMRRLDYATPHHSWLIPLARQLREQDQTVLVGLGGGILLNSHLQDPDLDNRGGDIDSRRRLFSILGGHFLTQGSINPSLCDAHSGFLLEDFLEASKPHSEHEGWQAMSILTTRTARSIAHLGTRLLGPELMVTMPFLLPGVIEAGLSPKVHRTRGDIQYRRILAEVRPGLDGPPSATTAPVGQRRYVPRQLDHETVRRMASTVSKDESALELSHPVLRPILTNGDVGELMELTKWTSNRYLLQVAFLLATFRKYHPRIGGFEETGSSGPAFRRA